MPLRKDGRKWTTVTKQSGVTSGGGWGVGVAAGGRGWKPPRLRDTRVQAGSGKAVEAAGPAR